MREPKYTTRQYGAILQTIAGRMVALRSLIIEAQGDNDEAFASLCIDAAAIIATDVGALADAASGCGALGSPECWHYGSAFEERGAA